MSATKSSRRRPAEAAALPAPKRQKVTSVNSGLGFLADEEARKGRKLIARLTNGIPNTKATRPDESRVVIETRDQDDRVPTKIPPHDVINISSAEEEESELEDSDIEEADQVVVESNSAALTNGRADTTADAMDEGDSLAGGVPAEESVEPSFGDLLAARHPQPIDVHASFADPTTQWSTLIPTAGNHAMAPPSTTSLSTVLTQALKTNDRDLLESCFQVTDLPSIRATIQRLSSQLIATLLQRLTERIHKAPGRAGILTSWIQWSLVAHGGYLAGQPEVMRRLKPLTQIMRERASGLEPLLHLKGKLDMLSAQLDLRRSMLVASRTLDEAEDEDAVLYVEDQDDGAWSEEDTSSTALRPKRAQKDVTTKSGKTSKEEDSDAESSAGNDVSDGDSDDASEDSEDGDGEGEGLIDIEAEETSDDEGEEGEEEDGEEDGELEEDEEDEDLSGDDEEMSDEDTAVRPPEPKTLNRKR